jgi:anthranilate phosphoribosyltransferase
MSIDPANIGINQASRAVPIPDHQTQAEDETDERAANVDTQALAQAAASAGAAALAGTAGPAYDSLVYGAALCLYHLKRQPSLQAAADVARGVIDSGEALARFRQNQAPQ